MQSNLYFLLSLFKTTLIWGVAWFAVFLTRGFAAENGNLAHVSSGTANIEVIVPEYLHFSAEAESVENGRFEAIELSSGEEICLQLGASAPDFLLSAAGSGRGGGLELNDLSGECSLPLTVTVEDARVGGGVDLSTGSFARPTRGQTSSESRCRSSTSTSVKILVRSSCGDTPNRVYVGSVRLFLEPL